MGNSVDLNLCYGGVLVGCIHDAFQTDGTWFGILEPAICSDSGELSRRLLEYITFCEDWNCRASDGSADTAEFRRYSDIVRSGLWATMAPAGDSARIADAPVFFIGNEITWRYA